MSKHFCNLDLILTRQIEEVKEQGMIYMGCCIHQLEGTIDTEQEINSDLLMREFRKRMKQDFRNMNDQDQTIISDKEMIRIKLDGYRQMISKIRWMKWEVEHLRCQ